MILKNDGKKISKTLEKKDMGHLQAVSHAVEIKPETLKENVMRHLPASSEVKTEMFALPFLCNYKGESREVHPAACQWHRDEKDPECMKCERY